MNCLFRCQGYQGYFLNGNPEVFRYEDGQSGCQCHPVVREEVAGVFRMVYVSGVSILASGVLRHD